MNAKIQLPSRRLLMALFLVLGAAILQAADLAPAVPGPDDRCPVCGTLVEPHQKWLAQVRLSDGSTVFFEGAKDMFRYLESPQSYTKDKRDLEIIGGFVTTFYDQKAIPLEDAWFVIGSDVSGPAGSELIPHRNLAQANQFVLEHGGTRVVHSDDVSSSLLSQLP